MDADGECLDSGERKYEFSYQRPLCALLAAQGFRYDPEVTQTVGRSDLIAEHPSGIWIVYDRLFGEWLNRLPS